MSLNPAMWSLTLTQVALWATLAILFWRKGLQHRFPAMGTYLAIEAVGTPLLAIVALLDSKFTGQWDSIYFFGYFALDLIGSVVLFFVTVELFRNSLVGFSGLQRFGTVIFRWIAVASVLITLSTVSFSTHDWSILPAVAYQFTRSVSIIELCLLAFLCLSMNALRLSPRDLGFGFALGFGIFASSDFILAAFQSWRGTLNDPAQFVAQAVNVLTLGIFLAYIALPEPARKPVVVSANSTVYRWNEIASALGHKGTQVAIPQPANSFFLTDVEKVVEKVLTRSLAESQSGS